MNWAAIVIIVAAYYGLSDQLKKISKSLETSKKEFPSLKELLNKKIELHISEDLDTKGTTGVLVKYDKEWLALSSIDKKGKEKLYFFRLSNIKSISIK